jgi:hypothetical protein
MICPFCSAPAESGSKFCPSCGKDLRQPLMQVGDVVAVHGKVAIGANAKAAETIHEHHVTNVNNDGVFRVLAGDPRKSPIFPTSLADLKRETTLHDRATCIQFIFAPATLTVGAGCMVHGPVHAGAATEIGPGCHLASHLFLSAGAIIADDVTVDGWILCLGEVAVGKNARIGGIVAGGSIRLGANSACGAVRSRANVALDTDCNVAGRVEGGTIAVGAGGRIGRLIARGAAALGERVTLGSCQVGGPLTLAAETAVSCEDHLEAAEIITPDGFRVAFPSGSATRENLLRWDGQRYAAANSPRTGAASRAVLTPHMSHALLAALGAAPLNPRQ